MGELYSRIASLCESRGITAYRMCKDIGIQGSIVSDLKTGRKKTINIETANKIATYFDITVDELINLVEPKGILELVADDNSLSAASALLKGARTRKYIDNPPDDSIGNTIPRDTKKRDTKKDAPAEIAGEDIMFALLDGDVDEITDEMFEEVKAYAKFVQERKKRQKDGDK